MKTFEQVEKEYLLNALKESNFSVTKASNLSGIPRSTYYKKLERYFGVGFIRNFKITAVHENKIIAIPLSMVADEIHATAKNIDLPST